MSPGTIVLGSAQARRELVLLPPVGGRPGDALAAGFGEATVRRQDALRVTLVDLPASGPAAPQQLEAVWGGCVEPPLRRGAAVWLAGVSLGAWQAVLMARRFEGAAPAPLAGLALIAPWLGTREVHRGIVAAGGLPSWAAVRPAPAAPAPGSLAEEEAAWHFLAANAATRLWLGAGTADRFAAAQRLLAAALPPGRACAIDGGHDWHCWGRIWEHLLAWLPTA